MRTKRAEQTIKKLLNENPVPKINMEKRKKTIQFVNEQFLNTATITKKPFIIRLKDQLFYISPITWLVQLILLLYCTSLFRFGNDYLNVFILSLLSPLIGLIGFCEINRSFSYQMWELEQACLYNLRELFGMKLVILGFVDLLILISIASMGRVLETSIYLTIWFIIIPFNLANCIYLFLLIQFNRRYSSYWLIFTGIVLSIVFNKIQMHIMEHNVILNILSSFGLTAIALLISLAICIFLVSWFLKDIEKEVSWAWN